MIMIYIIASLVGVSFAFFLVGIIKKNKVVENIGITIIMAVIIFIVGFISWSLYENDTQYKSQFEQQ